MAYDNGRYEVCFTALDLTSTGVKAVWSPGVCTHIVRGIAVIINATPGDAGVVDFDKRITIGSDTNRVDDGIGKINMLTTHTVTAGTTAVVVYKELTGIQVNPGEQIDIRVSDASANVNAATVVLDVERVYARPATTAAMIATT